MFRICKNQFIDEYRARRRRPVHQDVDTAEVATTDASPDVQAFLARQFDSEDHFVELFGDETHRALQELPEEFREAVLLVDLGDLTYEEAAEVVGCPVGTIRSRLARTRRRLAERLRDVARARGLVKE